MNTRPYVLEKQGDDRDSVRENRATFLRVVGELRPHVIGDLFKVAFSLFALAVAEAFKNQLVHGAVETQSGTDELLEPAMKSETAKPPTDDKNSTMAVLHAFLLELQCLDPTRLRRLF